MTSRQWLITVTLLALVAAAVLAWVATRDTGVPIPPARVRAATTPAPLVDESPLLSARALARLASDPEERQLADQIAQFADHEVDLAFHDALRDATHFVASAKDRVYFEQVSQAEAQVAGDKDREAELKRQLAAAAGLRQGELQDQLDLLQAQTDLDQDALDNARDELIRAGADPGSLIQRQFDEHQAAERTTDKPGQQATTGAAEANPQPGSLVAQFATWRALRDKAERLRPARGEAALAAVTLTGQRDTLRVRLTTERSGVAPGPPPTPVARVAAGPAPAVQSTVQLLRQLSDDQKTLADLDKRIEDERAIEAGYSTWIGLIRANQRRALHGMILSALGIFLIVLAVTLFNVGIDRYLAGLASAHARLHTLRGVIHSTAQAAGVLLILLVVLGVPRQLGTILGLAGAGLTVALKDFVLAFFGWFALMGKHGLRVGDWVEINGVAGEVVEINLMRTVLLETGNGVGSGHPTGRKVAFVNSYAIEGHFFNFTTNGQWLWDELQLSVPPDLDPYPLLERIQATLTKETESNARAAEQEWQSATAGYKVRAASATPAVTLRPTATGVEIHVRYIARAPERSAIRARLNEALVELLHRRGAGEAQPTRARGAAEGR
jgi:small-conductance mechanosensitive channel